MTPSPMGPWLNALLARSQNKNDSAYSRRKYKGTFRLAETFRMKIGIR